MADELPTEDEFRASLPELPNADEFRASLRPPQSLWDRLSAAAKAAPEVIFGGDLATARVLNAFGQGVEEGWGTGKLGLSEESQAFLKKSGIFNDYEQGQHSIVREFNEHLIRPLAIGLDIASRGFQGLLRGFQGAAETGLTQAGVPTSLARDIAALPEALIPEAPQIPGRVAEVEAARPAAHAAGRADMLASAVAGHLNQAAELGVIGKGEEGWAGVPEAIEALKPPRLPAEPEPRAGAVAAAIEDGGETAAAPAATAFDIHAAARQLAPEVFNEYDALGQQRETFWGWLDELGARRNPEDGDTAEMAKVRRDLLGTERRMRELAGPVSDAYQTIVLQRRGAAFETETAAAPPAGEAAAQEAPAAAAPQPQPEQATPAPPQRPIEPAAPPRPPLPGGIVGDVAQKLVAAGRPAEEADAAAAVVDAYYGTRAARFGGALGSAEDLYQTEGAAIRGAAAGGRAGMAAGRTTLRQGQATVTLFEKADASTFMHEMGHHWLDQMVRDADHEAAPEDLRADAQTVRDWLGAEPDATITRSQHERFARGFEQYLMEGRAPSAGLARVFEQFKGWLTQIYQTVAKLGRPINDDIRGVFDRMLGGVQREPVIAPETAIGRTFADLHEDMAAKAEPPQAIAAADEIEAERDRIARGAPDDIRAERSDLRTAAEGGGAEPGDRVPGRGGDARQPEPAGAGTGPQSGALGAGGEAPAAEGAGAPATAAAEHLEPADANAPIRSPRTDTVDKAGNIRLDLLGTPEDVNFAIRQAADENEDFISARRGVIPDAEVLRLADALGMDADKLNQRQLGQAFNAEEVVAARKLLIQSAGTVRDAMARAANGSDADVLAYAEAKARHRMIQSQVAGITAEAGRALRAFQALPGAAQEIGQFLENATGRTLYQLREEAALGAQLQTYYQVSKFVADTEKTGLFDWVQSYFVNALISGPATHGTYSVGNFLLALFGQTAERGLGAAIGAARRAMGRPGGVEFGEVPSALYGLMRGYGYDGWRAAWASFKANQTFMLPGEAAAGTPFRQQIIPGVAGTVIESPGRLINALHALARVGTYTAEIGAEAYRLASEEGRTGTDLANRIRDLTTNPTAEMMQSATTRATEAALMARAPYDSWRGLLSRITNKGVRFGDIPLPGGHTLPLGTLRPLKFVDPFVTISGNVINSTLVQRTPLGLLSGEVRGDLSGANGAARADLAAGRMMAGSALMVLGGTLASQGLLTGSPPADPRERAIKYMTGWQPYSIKIGDFYYGVHRLGVLGMALGIAADLWGIADKAATEGFDNAAIMATHAVARNILDESFMRGPADMIAAIESEPGAQARWTKGFFSSLLPFSVGLSQTARVIDPYMRQTRGVVDAMKAKIPFESETLLPRYDVWGRPIANLQSVVPEATAIYRSRVVNDPATNALLRLGVFPAQIERKIRGVELSDAQYDTYARMAGRLAKMRADAIVAQPGFTLLPDHVQHDMLRDAITKSREAARTFVMMQAVGSANDIVSQALAAKRALLTGTAPATKH